MGDGVSKAQKEKNDAISKKNAAENEVRRLQAEKHAKEAFDKKMEEDRLKKEADARQREDKERARIQNEHKKALKAKEAINKAGNQAADEGRAEE